uniref:NOC3-like protein n=1 Tax=Heliothis virescens TaxID=7102 RepID=A0A2A4JQY1_HELVI
MAKKGKIKISKVKRNNQTTNKMRKKGQLKLQRHRTHVQKQKQPNQQPQIEYSSESEPSGDEFGDMLDDEEQQYLMSRLSKQPSLLANVPENEKQNKRSRKRKKEKKEKFPKKKPDSDSGADSEEFSDSEDLSDSDVEEKYEKEQAERPVKKMRPLLPIKTKEGLQERAEECEDSDSESEEESKPPPKRSKQTDEQSNDEDASSDSGMEGTEDDAPPAEGEERVVTAVELMAARRDKLQHDKLRIGALCSSLLESPEKKLKNLFPILYLMEERLKDGSLNLHSIRKLATVSAFEVFKDILPEYMIRHQDYSNIKLKKDTLALYKYEKELLEFYKRYLQRLEKAAGVLRRKKGDTRKLDEHTLSLALVSLRCMCGLLVARPHFNYATNIAQSIVPHLDSKHEPARQAVTQCCTSVFAEDSRGDVTLALKNLFPILYLMEERLKDGSLNLHSIRKLATVSAFEVFKDILPEYMIRHQDYSNIKLKKDTLALYKYEKELLEFYKRYLQRLEKAAGVLRRKKGDTRKLDEHTLSLALVSLRCMCGLLVARPHFNYATNIAQSIVPHLDSKHEPARQAVTQCCTSVFAEDSRGDVTLAVVRLINQLVKRRGERLHPTALDCLLTLKIRDVDMDAEAEIKHKKKQDEKHKKRIVNLSKKEKKRNKKLKEVERELLETQATESELARRKQLTEVTKTVFHIYFRLLKTAPRSKLLASALNGLAKFTHVINLEYYSDLVAILGQLISDELLDGHSRLLCVRTVLCVLAGAGDALNVDPAKFHAYLYTCMLGAHAGKTHADAKTMLESVTQICARARRVSAGVLQAFAKRLASLAPQLHHNGALACLALLHQLAQQSKAVSTLLEADNEAGGSGRYDPFSPSPEHCNAHAALPTELCILRRHYHPTVRAAATDVLKGNLIQELHKMTPYQIFKVYDGSEMAFKPAVPPPKKTDANSKKSTPTNAWAQPDFKQLCESIESNVKMDINTR